MTGKEILHKIKKAAELGRGGSTAVTAILINGLRLVVANVGDSRAVLSKNGAAIQLSIDHEPSAEREMIEEKTFLVMSNQEVVDFIKDAKYPQTAAKNLTEEAVARKSKDDISCIVVKFN